MSNPSHVYYNLLCEKYYAGGQQIILRIYQQVGKKDHKFVKYKSFHDIKK